MKVIRKSTKEKLYSIRLTEDQYNMVKKLKKKDIDLPEMIRVFIENVYKENDEHVDQDDLYINSS